MKYNFDEIIDRTRTNCLKWDAREDVFGDANVLPMWVADMDFKSPDFVVDAITERLSHPVLGYTQFPKSYFSAIAKWNSRRNQWKIAPEWIVHTPGVVPGLNIVVHAFSKPGDKIVIQPPVYTPFFDAVAKNGRTVVENPLKIEDGRYVMDYELLDEQLAGTKAIIISNPHNPVGRVFSADELAKLGELCIKHNVLIVSDEIHSDIIISPNKHTCIANLSPELAERTITFMAPSKTFNLAGLSTAYGIIPNKRLRDTYLNYLNNALHLGMGNIAGIVGLEAAYTCGDAWLDQLNDYLKGNIELLADELQAHLPKITLYKPEGTYLAWLDFRQYGLSEIALNKKLISDAHLGLNNGAIFGKCGSGFMRINLACPRAYVHDALQRLVHTFGKI